jgi:hypothetical protein
MIRLVAFDLDGTLVGHNLTLTPRVRAAVAQAQTQGVAVTIATGRGPSPTDQYATQLGLTTPLACFQGGLVYDHQARQILRETRLDPACLPVIARLAQEHAWHLQFETPFMIYLPRESDHPAGLLQLISVAKWTRVNDFLTDLPEVPHKFILSVHDPAERDPLAAQARALLDEHWAAITVVPSHPILVEGLPPHMSKAVGLAWLAEHLGLTPAEVMAVGDNDNDVSMLEWAGMGVAMGNASPAARAAADWLAPSVAADGAAMALEKFVLA